MISVNMRPLETVTPDFGGLIWSFTHKVTRLFLRGAEFQTALLTGMTERCEPFFF